MDPQTLKKMLERVREGTLSPDAAVKELAQLPYEDLGFAKIDHHRALRRGFPETVFGEGKTPEQIVAIVERIAGRGQRALVTRTDADVHARVVAVRSEASAVIEGSATGASRAAVCDLPRGRLFCTSCSTNVFHSPQPGHLPSHLGDSCPH